MLYEVITEPVTKIVVIPALTAVLNDVVIFEPAECIVFILIAHFIKIIAPRIIEILILVEITDESLVFCTVI